MGAPRTLWLSGGTGLVGGRLLEALAGGDVTTRVVTRSPGRLAGRPEIEGVAWDGLRTKMQRSETALPSGIERPRFSCFLDS